jgi:hypothetical protein
MARSIVKKSGEKKQLTNPLFHTMFKLFALAALVAAVVAVADPTCNPCTPILGGSIWRGY